MKDYVREENCKFYVNEEKRKVVCTYDADAFIIDDYINEKLPLYTSDLMKQAKITAHFTGVATCAPEDKWDVAIGKRVAFLKMRKKFYRSYFNAANRVIDYLDNILAGIVTDFNTFGEKVESSIEREEKRLREAIGNANE